MSLYNILHGENDQASRLMDILDISKYGGVGRYRDCKLSKDGTRIKIYTRDGGDNREHSYYSKNEEGHGCSCTGCIMTYDVPTHPNYIRDYNDKFDNTYATIVYSVPEEYREECKKMALCNVSSSLDTRTSIKGEKV